MWPSPAFSAISYLLVLFDAVASIDAVRIVYAATQKCLGARRHAADRRHLHGAAVREPRRFARSKVYDKLVPGADAAKP